MGYFARRKHPRVFFDRKRPFETDRRTGLESPVVVRVFNGNVVFDEWHLFENKRFVDFNEDPVLRDECNAIWARWCNDYGRRHEPLFKD